MSGKAIRETLAALGVIASMVFVGLEIRQNTAVARGQTRQELALQFEDWLELRASNEEIDDLFYRGWVEEAELTAGQDRRAVLLMRIFITRLENVYLQVGEGLVDESALTSYGWGADLYFASGRFHAWWRSQGGTGNFDPGFVAFFDERFGLAP